MLTPTITYAALDATSIGVVITENTLSQPIIYCNSAFEQLTGFKKSEIIGRKCNFLQGNDLGQAPVEEIRQALKRGKHCQVFLRNYKKDGTLFYNELTISPIKDENDQITHFVGFQKDITAQKNAETALAETQRKLIHSEKLAAIGKLSAKVAHEIRNPLGIISLSIDQLKEASGGLDEGKREYIEMIQESVQRANKVVVELFKYSRSLDI